MANSGFSNKKFTRKIQAIEFINTFDNKWEVLSEYISFRELFYLKELPIDYSSIDIDEINNYWEYYQLLGELLFNTIRKQ